MWPQTRVIIYNTHDTLQGEKKRTIVNKTKQSENVDWENENSTGKCVREQREKF